MEASKPSPRPKRCSACERWLVISAFGVDRKRPDGRHNTCKSCINRRVDERKKKDPVFHRLLKDRAKQSAKRQQERIKNDPVYRDHVLQTRKTFDEWVRKKDPEAWSRKRKNWRMLHEYGITHDEYLAMYERQQGSCMICQVKSHRLAIDHCHTTGHVRALLCNGCNSGIGMLKDDPLLMRAAAEYVLRFQVKTKNVSDRKGGA